MIIPDYNVSLFTALSALMTFLAAIYVLYKIKYFLNNNSIVDLMSNE
jgi:hypothetical protein